MKINDKILSIPPYISCSWQSVSSIFSRGNLLVISLHDSEVVNIPGLKPEIIDLVFAHHSNYLEKSQSKTQGKAADMFFRLGLGNIEGLGVAIQHNPAHANASDINPEILNKFGTMLRMILPDDPAVWPLAEPHCNCPHCQIARTMNAETPQEKIQQKNEGSEEELVTEADLKFESEWKIEQLGEKLFAVTSRTDANEHYNVFLGEPFGCTCGKTGCDHIIAVLES